MHCIKTGARVYIHELRAKVAADVYAVGDETLVVYWNPNSVEFMGPSEARDKGATHFVMSAPRRRDDWLHDHKDTPVMVTQRRFVEGTFCE